MDKQGNNGKNGHTPPSGEIDYYRVFKNHVTLMEGYKTVLKNSISTRDYLWRTKFVESHIYKKLKMLRKIYSVEIATLRDSNTPKQTLKNLVEDIDKYQRDLSYFPNITTKWAISIILPTLTAIAVLCSLGESWLGESWLGESWSSIVVETAVVLGIFLLTQLVVFSVLFFGYAMFSFLDKRLLFIFPEYKLFPEDKPQRGFDKSKKRWIVFLGKENKGTIYEKENELFTSLKMTKIAEQGVDISIILFCIAIITAIVMIIAVAISDYVYLLAGIMLFFLSTIILSLIFNRRAK